MFQISEREFTPERGILSSVTSNGFVLFCLFFLFFSSWWVHKIKNKIKKTPSQKTKNPNKQQTKNPKTKERENPTYRLCLGSFQFVVKPVPIRLFHINAALCGLRLSRRNKACVKNWASCAEKSVSSDQLCTLLLGHKHLLASATEGKSTKYFPQTFTLRDEGSL